MALKHVRPEKRVPAFHLMVTGVIFIVVFLIAVWVFSSPAEVQPSGGKGDVARKDAVGFESGEDLPTRGVSADADEEDPGFIDRKKPDPTAEFVDEGGDGEGKDVEDVKPEPKPDPVQQEVKDEGEPDASGEEEKKEEAKEEEPKVEDTPIVEIKDDASAVTGQEGSPAGAELTLDNTEKVTSWTSQSVESKEEKSSGDGEEADRKGETAEEDEIKPVTAQSGRDQSEGDGAPIEWKSCEWSGAQDYIPCLDNQKALAHLKSTKHYEHRERHCPAEDEMPKCLVPLPEGYQVPITWPESRSKVWYTNVPHTKLANYKADQNWVKTQGDYLIFPGGGTQFKNGAGHYIDFIEKSKTDVAWGKRTRVILDVGCGVASFGGFLFDRNVLAMSLAPKDEHEAQVQFALERGIPAISAVMGTRRLPFPSNVFDVVHCARCRVPWEIEGGMLLLELNRMLRPGGFFIWSATPVYKRSEEDRGIWKAMLRLTSKICWDLLSRTTDASTGIGVAIFQKPTDNTCYDNRKKNVPPLCADDDKPDAAWYVPMNACVHRLPEGDVRGPQWPEEWPSRLTSVPAWLHKIPKGLYGRPAGEEFQENSEHWDRVIQKLYLKGLGIDWTHVRNVMDMSAGYGGFAAALADQPLWVMNVVPTHEPDTLPIIYERGLFGIYHDWCESFSTYPRTYDLLHADHVFSRLKKRCGIVNTLIEVDRIVRPEGWVIFRDKVTVLKEDVLPVMTSLHWLQIYHYEQDEEQIVVVQKRRWRPERSA